MASIKGKNTKPEIIVRKMLWESGIRYRIHDKSVFGTPDISIKKRKLAIFVDGCFWHGCGICYREPKTNAEFWRRKIGRNKKRREVVKKTLQADGWKIFEIWEHEINSDLNSEVQEVMKRFEMP